MTSESFRIKFKKLKIDSTAFENESHIEAD